MSSLTGWRVKLYWTDWTIGFSYTKHSVILGVRHCYTLHLLPLCIGYETLERVA